MSGEHQPWHGTSGGYSNHRCRCRDCTDAWRLITASGMEKRYARVKDPNDPRHGTYNFYNNHGCHCEACTQANRVHAKEYREKRKNK